MGIVVGVVILVLILQVMLVWFCCRRQLRALIASKRQVRQQQKKAGDVDLLTQSTPAVEEWSSHRSTASLDESVSPFWDGNAVDVRSPTPGEGSLLAPGGIVSSASSPISLEAPRLPRLRLGSDSSDFELLRRDSQPSPAGSYTGHVSGYASPVSEGTSGPSRPKGSLQPANPDPGVEPDNRIPPQHAPRGGFRRHEDAGRLDVEDLPPLYDSGWRGGEQQ